MKFQRLYSKVSIGLLAVLCITFLVSCVSDESGDEPIPVQPVEQTLFLFFPYADNLTTNTSFIPSDIREIKDYIRSKDGISGYRIIVYYGKSANQGGSTVADLYEMRYEDGTFLNDTIEHFDNAMQSDKEFLASLFSKVKAYTNTRSYAMVTGGHGCGWIPSPLYYGFISRSFGGASEEPLRIDISTFRDALHDSSLHLQYILFDDCLMSNIEVLYALRNSADYIIATPAEQPGEGMPYMDIMPYLTVTPQYEHIAEVFVSYYGDFTRYSSRYQDSETGNRANPAAICIVKCSEIGAVATSMKELNNASLFTSIGNPDDSPIQRMDQASMGIFYDLVSYAETLAQASDAKAQLHALRQAVDRATVSARHGGYYLARGAYCFPINSYCGITTSDPSLNQHITFYKEMTDWWAATH